MYGKITQFWNAASLYPRNSALIGISLFCGCGGASAIIGIASEGHSPSGEILAAVLGFIAVVAGLYIFIFLLYMNLCHV